MVKITKNCVHVEKTMVKCDNPNRIPRFYITVNSKNSQEVRIVKNASTQRSKTRVTKLLKKCIADAQAAGVPIDADKIEDIKLNHRRDCIGLCQRCTTARKNKFVIFFSDFYLALSDKEISNVLMHELIHTLPNCWDHGVEFRQWMLAVNAHGYNVEVSNRGERAAKLRATCEAALVADKKHVVIVGCKHGCRIPVSCRSKVARYPEYFECKLHSEELHVLHD